VNSTSTPRFDPSLGTSQFECVPPTRVREDLVGRPQVGPKHPQVRRQAQGGAPGWLVGALVSALVIVTLYSIIPRQAVTQALPTPLPTPTPTPVVEEQVQPQPQVHRARLVHLPRAPRAELLRPEVGQLVTFQIPSGLDVRAVLKGAFNATGQLPMHGNHLGDAYQVGENTWVWLYDTNAHSPSWIDP
jgi:hypothetical protein